jgi:hypothetical protein
MGIIIPSIELSLPESIDVVSNAYLAIGHNDINFRNYSPNMQNVPISANPIPGNNIPLVSTIMPGMSVLINYGVWNSQESRNNGDLPLSMLTRQYAYESNANISNVYEYAYSLLKSSYSNAIDA